MTRAIAALAVACLVLATSSADARPRHVRSTLIECNQQGCAPADARVSISAKRHAATDTGGVISERGGRIIGGRPAGCPPRYCGCGLRKYLGLSDKRLDLAWNWAKLFPREPSPRAGLAAVRHGHVMYIEASAGDGRWMIRDYNSGKGLSRLHVRDVRGYIFVNPHSQMASR